MKTLKKITLTLFLSILFYSCDKNEYAPEISDQDFIVAENTPEGYEIGTIVASDLDAGQKLSFEIIDGNQDGVFAINKSTGSLLVNNVDKLDYESTMHYILQVMVSDNHKNEPLESSANIYIEVTDANESAPEIPPGLEGQIFTILENSPAGTLIGTVEFTDDDSEQTLNYRISDGNESGVFSIDQEDGTITVANSTLLNYELDTVYMITITVADDFEDDPLESSATIQIDVLDENEFAPAIENQSYTIDENPANGVEIAVIVASDDDIYQSLIYSIIEGEHSNYLDIDPHSGTLSIKDSTAFDFEINQTISVRIQVIDDHQDPKTSEATITIELNNVIEITYEEQVFNAINDSLTVADSITMVMFLNPGADFDDYMMIRSFSHNPEYGNICILNPTPDSLQVYFKVGPPLNESYHSEGTYGISNSSIDSMLTLFRYYADVGFFVPQPVYVQEVIHAEENIHSNIIYVLCIYLKEDFANSAVYTPVN